MQTQNFTCPGAHRTWKGRVFEENKGSAWRSGELPLFWWREGEKEKWRDGYFRELSWLSCSGGSTSGLDFQQQQNYTHLPPLSLNQHLLLYSTRYRSVTSLPHGPSPLFPSPMWVNGRSICHIRHSYTGGKEDRKKKNYYKHYLGVETETNKYFRSWSCWCFLQEFLSFVLVHFK